MSLKEYTATGFIGAQLNPENRWGKLSKIVPWKQVDELYAENFTKQATGNPAIESRMVFGALMIQQEYGFSDERTVEEI